MIRILGNISKLFFLSILPFSIDFNNYIIGGGIYMAIFYLFCIGGIMGYSLFFSLRIFFSYLLNLSEQIAIQ